MYTLESIRPDWWKPHSAPNGATLEAVEAYRGLSYRKYYVRLRNGAWPTPAEIVSVLDKRHNFGHKITRETPTVWQVIVYTD